MSTTKRVSCRQQFLDRRFRDVDERLAGLGVRPRLDVMVLSVRQNVEVEVEVNVLPCVPARNPFPEDLPVYSRLSRLFLEVSDVFVKGGEGGEAIAEAIEKACEEPSDFQHLYDVEDSIEEKITKIATTMYGADGVDFADAAKEDIARYEALGYDKLPICMAKTHLSLSHDPKLKGRPKGFRLPVRDIRLAAGAGFLYPLAGTMMTMPGLGSKPALEHVDIDEDGQVVGLF